jgi:Spy/CpxP family protein refolding chaperone
MDDFGGKLMGFFFSDPDLLASMFSGQNLTDAQNQRIFEFMYNDKDFPKFVALSMRNDSSSSWLAKAPYAQQLKFANIMID